MISVQLHFKLFAPISHACVGELLISLVGTLNGFVSIILSHYPHGECAANVARLHFICKEFAELHGKAPNRISASKQPASHLKMKSYSRHKVHKVLIHLCYGRRSAPMNSQSFQAFLLVRDYNRLLPQQIGLSVGQEGKFYAKVSTQA